MSTTTANTTLTETLPSAMNKDDNTKVVVASWAKYKDIAIEPLMNPKTSAKKI